MHPDIRGVLWKVKGAVSMTFGLGRSQGRSFLWLCKCWHDACFADGTRLTWLSSKQCRPLQVDNFVEKFYVPPDLFFCVDGQQ
jgi:hypothetical protein